jgi:hypothetical protein
MRARPSASLGANAGSPHVRAWWRPTIPAAMAAAASMALLAPARLGAPAVATQLVLTTAASAPAPPVPADTSRPAGCPPSNGDPNTANDGATVSPDGTVPWPPAPPGVDPEEYAAYLHTHPVGGYPERPANWTNGGGDWKLTSARSTDAQLAENPQELCGVEGNSVDRAWERSTGRPDTVIAITDSGIEWCDSPVVDKIHLNEAALPYPENAQGLTKPQLEAAGRPFADADPYDLEGSGVVNVAQYAHDPRVLAYTQSAYGGLFCGSFMSPEDLIRTFGNPASPWYYPTAGSGAGAIEQPPYPGQSPPGFTEAIAGWNFVDDTNDPYDDVLYGHGTGEAEDATAAADSVGEVGACPDCTVLPIRVGESFIAEGNDFARGVLFAVDSGASVLQEALGTLDVTATAAQAIAYANAHGVPVVSSAADEEAEHHNEPGDLPGTIVVNSSTQGLSENGVELYDPPSYLYLNGCTNYGANIAVTVESASCSSEATGKTGGITGLIESEAKNLLQQGELAAYPGLESVAGTPVALSSTEVRELIEMSADPVDFQTPVVPSGPDAATTLPEPPDNNLVLFPYPTTRYPSQPGYDMYTGYGRIDAGTILSWLAQGKIPPEAAFGEMQWFQTYDPTRQSVQVPLFAAAVRTPGTYRWELQYGVGTQPGDDDWYDITGGTGQGGPPAQGGTPLSETVVLAPSLLRQIAAKLPPSDNGTGPGGTPQPDAPAFTLRLVVTDAHGLVGMDRRTEYLEHDPTLVTPAVLQPGQGAGTGPVTQLATDFGGSVDAAPTLAPIGPEGTDALVVATADGTVHAYLPQRVDGTITLSEMAGWPVDTEELPGQAEITSHEPAYTSGAVSAVPHCSIVGGVAVGDLSGAKGPPQEVDDVVASDMCGYVYAWNAQGQLLPGFPVRTDPAYSEDPAPFASAAVPPGGPQAQDYAADPRDPDNRLLPGILGAPALADLTGNGQLDVVVSSLDRHVYAWTPAGTAVPGYPELVVDPSVVQSVNPTSDHVTFKPSVNVQQGTMILDTPAVGDLAGAGGPPDLVVGTNEEYGCNPATLPGANLAPASAEPSCAVSVANAVNWGLTAVAGLSGLLNPANSPLFALAPQGAATPPRPGQAACSEGTAQPDACAILPGWPAQMTDLDAGLLPSVGDGTNASPALADLAGDGRLEVGDMTAVGPGYIFRPDGTSYLGTGPDGQPVTLSMTAAGPLANSHDLPSIPGLGFPIFAPLGAAAPGISFIAPATSLGKALDAALPAEQYANDNQLDAWSPLTGTMQAAFPQVMNDLQFFDQPLAADVGGAAAGPYVVEGSATSDLRAINDLGQEAPGFPKFTGGWIVNSPSFGPFGTLADQVLVAGTRDGDLFVWSTPTPASAPSGPWPKQHHDLENTSNLGAPAAPAPVAGLVAPVAAPVERQG